MPEREYRYAIQSILVKSRALTLSSALELVLKSGFRPGNARRMGEYWFFPLIADRDPRWEANSFMDYPHTWVRDMRLRIGRLSS